MSHKFLSISPLNDLNSLDLSSDKRLLDNITGSYLNTDTLKLNPYQVVWLTLAV
jgi:sucrose phosphorylase